MICTCCKQEKDLKDFYGKSTCYKCTYSLKVFKKTKTPIEIKKCKICNAKLPKNRWKYCCEECAYVANENKHWSRLLVVEKIYWGKS